MATMEFAALCLDNALLLLPDQPATATQPPLMTTGDGPSEQRFVTGTGDGPSEQRFVAGTGDGPSEQRFVTGTDDGPSEQRFVAGTGDGPSEQRFVAVRWVKTSQDADWSVDSGQPKEPDGSRCAKGKGQFWGEGQFLGLYGPLKSIISM